MDRTLRHSGGQLSEEFVIGDIKNLHRYISKITLVKDSGFPDFKIWNLYLLCRKYSKKWNIPFYFDKSILSDRKEQIRNNIYDP